MIIAVDHGNKQMKTANTVFTSGLLESDVKPPFGEGIIKFKDKFYALTEKRISVLRDKTVDNRFYILTLFAVAFEIEATGSYNEHGVTDITLLAGLPPAHYGAQYEAFEKYFLRNGEPVSFTFNDRPFNIRFTNVCTYPQAYAAAMPIYSTLAGLPKVTVIDIGGFTADYLQIIGGKQELGMCDSLDNGVIRLYSTIRSKVNSTKAIRLEESEIDAVLSGGQVVVAEDIQELIFKSSQAFVNEFLSLLAELMIELRTGKVIFVGGGSIRLRKQIEASQKVAAPMFVDDIKANVKGYELLYIASQLGQ